MKKATAVLCKDFISGKTDDRLFGSFVEHMGATVYNGIFEPGHGEADENGFRRDVLALIRELGLSVIRYPGGNFTSGYNWEDTVGPLKERPTRLELAWKAIEPNTFGLNEFMKWISMVPAEPIMTINLGTRGVDAARNIVEYCNYEKGSYYSDLRRSHGVEEPYKIKTWCLGNELDGPWQIGAKSAEEYGRLAFEAGKVMKWVDPEIELVAVGSSNTRMAGYPEWDRKVLMETYEIADYIALHQYIDHHLIFNEVTPRSFYEGGEESVLLDTPDFLARSIHVDRQINSIVAACDYVKAVKRSKRTMYLSFDEWNSIAIKKHKDMDYTEWEIGSPYDCGAHSMEEALSFASIMMSILRRADRIKIACQSLLVNTGPMIVAQKNGVSWRNTIFYPFMHMSLYGRGNVLTNVIESPVYSSREFSEVPVIDSLAVYNGEKNELTYFAVNRSSEPVNIEIDVRDFGQVELIDHITMQDTDINSANTADNPNRVVPKQAQGTQINAGRIESTLQGYSWNVIRMKCNI